MASVRLGARRLQEITARFGADIFANALAQLLARTETLVRQKLRETFPVGTHRFTDAIDSDGHGNGPFRIRFALTRTADDRFIFDATETDDQAVGPVNFLMNRDVPARPSADRTVQPCSSSSHCADATSVSRTMLRWRS